MIKKTLMFFVFVLISISVIGQTIKIDFGDFGEFEVKKYPDTLYFLYTNNVSIIIFLKEINGTANIVVKKRREIVYSVEYVDSGIIPPIEDIEYINPLTEERYVGKYMLYKPVLFSQSRRISFDTLFK
ncbi:MAG: hypothetical protein RLZZ367_1962 [Bacteroidota bacterium]